MSLKEFKCLSITDQIINDIAKQIKNAKIGIIPTDTIYGLVGIANSISVKNRIYDIKQRDFAKQLVVQVGRNYDLTKIVTDISESAKLLMDAFMPGAITLIFKAASEFIENYDWEIETVAIRIPNHELFLGVLELINEPVFVTSANISGGDVINDFEMLKQKFYDKVDFIVNDGHSYEIVPSTIVDVSGDKIEILREGVISKKEIISAVTNK